MAMAQLAETQLAMLGQVGDCRTTVHIYQINTPPCSCLFQIFPRHIIEYMSAGGALGGGPDAGGEMGRLARAHQDVTILFMDIVGESPESLAIILQTFHYLCPIDRFHFHVQASPTTSTLPGAGFTSMSKQVPPVAVMNFLNWLFTGFDELADVHKVYCGMNGARISGHGPSFLPRTQMFFI